MFIDEEDTICAVGYLIESSAGREVAEKIAKAHRYDFIETIAADMPEVASWIASSGMTLEEIQTIQPAVLVVMPGKDGVTHAIHQGTPGKDVEANDFRLEAFSKGRERLYIQKAAGDKEEMFTADGLKLTHGDDGWKATNCHWSTTRKTVAQQGDVARLNGVLSADALRRTRVLEKESWDVVEDPGSACNGEVEISANRAAKLDVLLASRDLLRSASPDFVRKLVLGQEDDAMPADADPDESAEDKLRTDDLARVLAGNMAMYIEWPHIDRRFKQVYETMPGRYEMDWANRNSETDDDVNYVAPDVR